jgi:tetratricopeptide (TPR) repeat protein
MAIRRSAWVVVAHGSFELAEYPQAEHAYAQVLAVIPEDEEERAALVDNLAAAIYKQGESANEAEEYRTAADHFLRIRTVAPTSTIRATAEYDAGDALLALEDWTAAASVLEAFRSTYPEHKLQLEATRSIAYAYKEDGQLSRAADEYDRIASQAEDPALRSEALLVAGDLYEQSQAQHRALEVYRHYVDEFPQPVGMALETRLKIAEIHKVAHDDALYQQELAAIVCIERDAGPERTDRTRTIAARSALVLAEQLYQDFVAVKLLQPFEISLEEKNQRMDVAIKAMEDLVTYEIADVTAAATYYMAETYFDFSRSLAESERPADLQPEELAEYELVLEEEAFPFEERAIDLHEENLELLHAGVFNSWTEQSLGKLTELMPGRYAKNEMSSGFVGTIGIYVYRTPATEVYGPQLGGDGTVAQNESVQTTHLAPMALDD